MDGFRSRLGLTCAYQFALGKESVMKSLKVLATFFLACAALTAQDATRPPGWVVLPINE